MFVGFNVLRLQNCVETESIWRGLPASAAFRTGTFWLLVLPATLAHSSWSHLLPNVICLWFLGAAAEEELGTPNWSLLFFLAAIAGTGLELAVSGRAKLGVSGVDYAMFGVLLARPPRIAPGIWRIVVLGLFGWMTWGLVGATVATSGVGNVAHLSGLALGLAAGLQRRWSRHKHET